MSAAWPTTRGAAMHWRRQQRRFPAAAPPAAATSSPRRARRPTRARAAAAAASPNENRDENDRKRLLLLSTACSQLDGLLARTTPPSLALAGLPDPTADAAEDGAVALVRARPDLFLAFGRARMLPKRDYTIDELRLNKIEPEKLLSPRDASLIAVRNGAQVAALAGLLALAAASRWDSGQVLLFLAGATFVFGVDAVALGGGLEALAVDSLGRAFLPDKYARRVALHEAAHFLVAYLCGLLPRGYVLSSWGAVVEAARAAGGGASGGRGGGGSGSAGAAGGDGKGGASSPPPASAPAPSGPGVLAAAVAAAQQAGTTFCDAAFRREVLGGRLSGASLDRYSAAALAGVVAEYLSFGQAEGGVGDVAQLDRLFGALGFTPRKAAAQVRWAVLSDAALLRRHARAHSALADAMQRGESVGRCVAVLERWVAEDAAADPGVLVSAEEEGDERGEKGKGALKEAEAQAAAATTATNN